MTASPILASRIQRFSSPCRRFTKVDVVRFPELAAEFSVDTSAMTKQLPTVALFYRGREVKSDLSS